MSESIAEKLSQFTPDATTLNRDALLVEAGRASARPNRRWQSLAAMLVISQCITLMILWPQPVHEQVPIVRSRPSTIIPPPAPRPEVESPPRILWTMNKDFAQQKVSTSTLLNSEEMIPPTPPLRASSLVSNIVID